MSRPSTPVRALLVSVVLGGVGYLGTYLIAPTFASYASLYFPQAQTGAAAGALGLMKPGVDADSGVVRSLGGALTSPLVGSGAQTATGILTSQTCLREVISKHGLTKKWDLPIEKALGKLRGRVNASVDKNGFLIFQLEADSPDEATVQIKTFMGHLDRRAEELSLNVSRRNRQIIESRVSVREQQLEGLQNEMVEVMRGALVTNLPEVQRIYLETRQELTIARIREASAQAQLNSIERSLSSIYAQAAFPANLAAVEAVNASLTKLTEEIQTRRLTLEEVGNNFKRESPEYRTAVSAVKNAETIASRVLDSASTAVQKGLTPELAHAKAELAALRSTSGLYDKSLASFEKELAESPAKYATVERARSEFQAALVALSTLRGELELSRIAEVRDPSRYELVDSPFPDREAVSPRRALMAGAVFLLAFAFQIVPFVMRRLREEESD